MPCILNILYKTKNKRYWHWHEVSSCWVQKIRYEGKLWWTMMMIIIIMIIKYGGSKVIKVSIWGHSVTSCHCIKIPVFLKQENEVANPPWNSLMIPPDRCAFRKLRTRGLYILSGILYYSVVQELRGSSSPYESNRASPTGGRRPLPFKRNLMGLSLSLWL
jgi:hypothetical protein